jgi:hypothetical protein
MIRNETGEACLLSAVAGYRMLDNKRNEHIRDELRMEDTNKIKKTKL